MAAKLSAGKFFGHTQSRLEVAGFTFDMKGLVLEIMAEESRNRASDEERRPPFWLGRARIRWERLPANSAVISAR